MRRERRGTSAQSARHEIPALRTAWRYDSCVRRKRKRYGIYQRAVVPAKKAGKKSGVIATDESAARYRADIVKSVGSRADELSAAKHLYTVLREMDEEGAEVIYSEAFTGKGIGEAVMNRLLKAAGYHMVQV